MAARTPHQHVYSLGMQIVHDSSGETDGDVSDFELEAGYPAIQSGAEDEESSSSESGSESEPAVSIRPDDSDAKEEMSDRAPSPSPPPSPSSSPSTLRLESPAAAAAAAPRPAASPSPRPSPAPRRPPPAARAPAFNPAPSHFVRTRRGRSTVWSMADWAAQRGAVVAAEARRLANERRWAINGGRGPISRRRAWRRANAGRARDARGRFVRQ